MNARKPIVAKTDESDLKALDRLAAGVTPEKLRPLTPAQRGRWEAARRGRPKKPPGFKAVPTLITVEPQLLRRPTPTRKRGASAAPNSLPMPSGSDWPRRSM
jgi:hypothetical protein